MQPIKSLIKINIFCHPVASFDIQLKTAPKTFESILNLQSGKELTRFKEHCRV